MPTVAPLDLDGHCVAAAFLGGVPHFALADGTVHRLEHGHKWQAVHDGLLAAALDWQKRRLITGGEDGRVFASAGEQVEPIAEMGRKWVTSVAAGPQGAIAFAAGRNAVVRFADGKLREFAHPRSVEGLAFAPRGMRLAVARYNGATLHWVAAEKGQPTELGWDGAHTGITFSPDGNFLVTTMQENALHGWKLSDSRHMRMTGYPAKVKSLSWSAKGKWLASSGAPAAIVWPFQGKDGPMGKAPLELGTRGDTLVTCVACHPSQDIAAIGYADGMVMAARFADAREVLLRRPGKGAVTSMMWDEDERRIAFGTEAGDCGVIDISG
jgi:WD40 repeat protein